jgi:indole-3-acetate monooxygenase
MEMTTMANAPVATPLVEVARSLVPLVLEYAEQGEADRCLPAPVTKAFTEAGLFRMCRPRELGGLEADPITVMEVVEELARADGATGWVAMILGAGSVFAGILPKEGAQEIFADRNVASGGSFALTGRAVPVDGGYRVSGRWSFMSGCHQCQWLGGSCIVFDGDKPRMGPFGPEIVVPLCPVADGKIVDTWNVAGLRGTGSHDFELSDVFVPRARCAPMPPPGPTFSGPLYAFPFFGFLSISIAACAAGIARAAVDELVRVAKTKTPFGMTSTLSTRSSAQIAVSEAHAALLSGRAMLRESVRQIWDKIVNGSPVSAQDRALLRLAATNMTLSAARAVDLAYTAGGGSALYAKSPLQRCLRDIRAITQHATVASHTHELFGKILLGVEADAPLL